MRLWYPSRVVLDSNSIWRTSPPNRGSKFSHYVMQQMAVYTDCRYIYWEELGKWQHILECAILNAYTLDSHIHPLEHALRRRKRDYLTFRLQLAEELVGGFCSCKRAGRHSSSEHSDMQRLTVDLGHWPQQSPKCLGCVVCTRRKSRHESCITCSVCKVHLCIHGSRDCFKKYHTLVEYWH